MISVTNTNYTYLVETERKYIRFPKKIDQILPQINGSRKRMINVNLILKTIFQMLGAQCDHIQIAKSKKTLAIYEQYWNQIMNLIGDKIKRIIQQ